MDDLPFSAVEYSKFKHGSKRVSRIFGTELGNKFYKDLHIRTNVLPNTKDLIVCSAPYKFIPVASTILKDYFISSFNRYWTVNNKSVVDLKVSRAHSYNVDYGKMTSEERDKAITSDDFYIDPIIIKDKTLIFIDDIRITGAHERRMETLLTRANFDGTVIFVYFADLIGDSNPNIENDLNYAFVKDLYDIDYIIKNDEFKFNTRVVKFILKSPQEKFVEFIKYQGEKFKHTLHTNAIGNDYHQQEEFKDNFNILNNLI